MNKLIHAKIQLNQTKSALEDQLDSLKQRSTHCDTQIQQLTKENERLDAYLQSAGTNQIELTDENLDTLVYPADPYSAKIIEITSKENAIEDCLVVLKKAYEKEGITLSELL